MEAQSHNKEDRSGEDQPRELTFRDSLKPTRGLTLPLTQLEGFTGLEIDRAVFTLDAVLRAAYKFTDRLHVFVKSSPNGGWLVMVKPRVALDLPQVLGDFGNELIDQILRQRLEQQFGSIRTMIVAQAFSEGELLKDYNFETDPLDIGEAR